MIDIELERARAAMAESVTLPIAQWLEVLDELETLRAKREWVDLTDSEIESCYQCEGIMDWIRAVIAAFKEKNT